MIGLYGKLIGAAGAIAVLAALYFVGDARGAARVQSHFDAFKQVQSVLAAKQLDEIAALERERAADRQKLETAHAEQITSINARYDAKLRELRQRPGGAGAGGLPGSAQPAAVCADAAGNQRLSDALQRFRVGVVELFGEAERQAAALKTCQAWVREISAER